jgi:hypothetical protein
MTGPEHFIQGERLLDDAATSLETTFEGYNPMADRMIAEATAHFLAAQVALTAMSQPIAGMPDEPGLDQEDFDDWYAAVNGLTATPREAPAPAPLPPRRPFFDSLPHGSYINAVSDALANAGLGAEVTATQGVSDPMTGNPAERALRAVFRWTELSDAVSEARPHGMLLYWTSTADGWMWAERHEDGSHAEPEMLPKLDLYSAPGAVVNAVRALFDDRALPEVFATYWHSADAVRSAVQAWADADGDGVTNADVMSASELHGLDQADELALDAAAEKTGDAR